MSGVKHTSPLLAINFFDVLKLAISCINTQITILGVFVCEMCTRFFVGNSKVLGVLSLFSVVVKHCDVANSTQGKQVPQQVHCKVIFSRMAVHEQLLLAVVHQNAFHVAQVLV